MIVKEFTDRREFLCASINSILKLCGGEKETGYVALAGGSLKQVYEALALKIKNRDLEFFQTDERYVSSEDENSNYKMLSEVLTNKIHHFDTSLDIPNSLAQYKKKLEVREREFDLSILGVGSDGHIASLFPKSEALESKDLVAHTQTDNFSIHDRLTLCFSPIMASKNIIILLIGKNKKQVFETLLHSGKTFHEFPAKKLLEHKNLFIYFLNN